MTTLLPVAAAIQQKTTNIQFFFKQSNIFFVERNLLINKSIKMINFLLIIILYKNLVKSRKNQ